MFLGIGLGLTQQAIGGGVAGLNAQIASAAGIQPAISADLKSGQAWLRGAPYALTSLPGWSFSRALAAYGETSAGVLQPFASGAPRLVNGRGQLIEGARTNEFLQSQDWSATWSNANVTVTTGAITAPDGTLTGNKLEAATSAATSIYQSRTINATSCTLSCYMKKGSGATDGNLIAIRNQTTTTDLLRAGVNFDTLEITYAVGSSGVSVTQLADGWIRVVATVTSGITSGNSIRAYTCFAVPSETAGEFAYAWGAQLEAASFASSYIPTAGSTVTRPADIPLIDISAYSPAITYPLTMYARFERVVDTGSNEIFLQCDDGTENERALLQCIGGGADTFQPILVDGGVVQYSSAVAGALALGTVYRGASRFAENDCRGARSGTLNTQDTSATLPVSPTSIRLGMNTTGNFMFGYLSEFAIIPGAVSDANLPRLAPA